MIVLVFFVVFLVHIVIDVTYVGIGGGAGNAFVALDGVSTPSVTYMIVDRMFVEFVDAFGRM